MREKFRQSEREDMPPKGADPQNPSADLLLWAYRRGIFPMGDPQSGLIEWFSPDPRGIIPLEPRDAFHVPESLMRVVRRKPFAIRSDTDFEQVIRACDTPRSHINVSWLNERLIPAYIELNSLGYAHSVEAWLDEKLVGGLYGVHIGGAFFGESMFVKPDLGGTNASKVCLVHLVNWLRNREFILLDTQFWNPHLDQFGCMEIPAAKYLGLLSRAVRATVTWGDFEKGQAE